MAAAKKKFKFEHKAVEDGSISVTFTGQIIGPAGYIENFLRATADYASDYDLRVENLTAEED